MAVVVRLWRVRRPPPARLEYTGLPIGAGRRCDSERGQERPFRSPWPLAAGQRYPSDLRIVSTQYERGGFPLLLGQKAIFPIDDALFVKAVLREIGIDGIAKMLRPFAQKILPLAKGFSLCSAVVEASIERTDRLAEVDVDHRLGDRVPPGLVPVAGRAIFHLDASLENLDGLGRAFMVVAVDEGVSSPGLCNRIGAGGEPIDAQVFVSRSALYRPENGALVRAVHANERGYRKAEIDPQIRSQVLVMRKSDVGDVGFELPRGQHSAERVSIPVVHYAV